MEKAKRLKSSRYMSGLDGLRALAVIGVIFYHLTPHILPGGFLGVPIFFVLSGYLISDLLIQEFEQNGKISLKSSLSCFSDYVDFSHRVDYNF